ncbi:MAG: sigma-70 family RNA polymerase sigma factor [Gemmataceae bacterium]|nr:sigma-70 family RNA polymerase sigma factor [Gemmataceae bacterium]
MKSRPKRNPRDQLPHPRPLTLKGRAELLRRAEFEELYLRHTRKVWAVAYARWLNADVASDIMQEAFLRLWRQWQEGGTIDNPHAWLIRVARNLAEDYAKSSFRRNGTQSPQTMNGLQSRLTLPLENMERAETFGQIRQELEQLTTADREILTLRYAMDMNANEIADLLEINPTAVHMRLSRARQRLAERLTSQGVQSLP